MTSFADELTSSHGAPNPAAATLACSEDKPPSKVPSSFSFFAEALRLA